MKQTAGFTFIEMLVFIIIVGILASTMMLTFVNGQKGTPQLLNNMIAAQSARTCIEWFLGQRQLLGYNAFSCPSTTVPSFCTVPTGFAIAVNITCTTINSDNNYKTIVVTISGNGNASSSTLVANY